MHPPVVSLLLLLETLDLLHAVLVLPLEVLQLLDGIVSRGDEEALLLVPLSSVGLVLKDEISLLSIHVLSLVLEVVILLLENVLFSFVLASHFVKLSISVDLDLLILFLEPISVLGDPLDFLLEATLFGHHTLGAEFQSLIECFVLFFEPSDGAVELVHLGRVSISQILKLLLVLGVHLLHDGIVRCIVLILALILGLVKLIDGLSELLKGLLVVLLGLLFLLLKELKFTFPEGLLLLELALEVGVGSLHLVVLALPLLHLFPDAQLTLR